MNLDVTLAILYLLAGCLSTIWVEELLVDQGLGDELGLALPLGDRIRSIVLWPIFTGGYLLSFITLFVKNMMKLFFDDQQ